MEAAQARDPDQPGPPLPAPGARHHADPGHPGFPHGGEPAGEVGEALKRARELDAQLAALQLAHPADIQKYAAMRRMNQDMAAYLEAFAELGSHGD
jgi:hypothetical protein